MFRIQEKPSNSSDVIVFNVYSGLKYEKENEEDLKDQINFPKTPEKYPPNRKFIMLKQ